jgi:hypothetical protein
MTHKPPSINDDVDDVPLAGLRGLRQIEPPASLVPAVMRAIAEPRPVSFWQWLLRPRRLELRVTPVSLMGVAAAAVLAIYAVGTRSSNHGAGTPVLAEARSPGDVVQVRFVLVAKGARKVGIAGDFNGWNADGTVLENVDGQGTFVATVPLGHGAHEYMFLVDGKWLTDPSAAETRPDGFGQTNAVLRL